MVWASSPEIDNRRSVTAAASVRPLNRASEIIATVLPSNGHKPKLVPRLDSVGPAMFSAPISHEERGQSFPCRFVSARQATDFLLAGVRRQKVAEPFLQRADALRVVWP